MSIEYSIKQVEIRLTLVGDQTQVLHAKIEDLLFRSQRIANAIKNGLKSSDSMFGYDLQHFRRALRSYSMEVISLPGALSALEREIKDPDPALEKQAKSLSRKAGYLQKQIENLQSTALLAHQFMRQADHKLEGWYICQEVSELADKSKSLPGVSQKIAAKISKTE